MKTSGVLITAGSVAVISALATLQISAVAPWLEAKNFPKTMDTADVVFTVDEANGKLKITSGVGPGCKKEGCFTVTKGRSGRLKFQFNADPEWQLSKFEICKGATKPTHPCSLGVWERLEFAASDTKDGTNLFHTGEDGIIRLKGVKPGKDSSVFYLFDQNAIAGHYFYTIEACKSTVTPTDTGTDADLDTDKGADAGTSTDDAMVESVVTTTCYTTDPPIQNGGRR